MPSGRPLGAGQDGPGIDLELRDVCLSYRRRDGSELPVLEGIRLHVAAGEFVSVVGASGCGKTTLLRIANGLARPDRGEVLVSGRRLTGPSPLQAFVFQEDLLLPWRSVLANVLFPLELRGELNDESRRFAARLLEVVGLAGFERSYPHELSVGMRQRVNLARALVVSPGILLLDEPFAPLDAQTREILQDELLRIWDLDRKTVLFVTHQIDEAVYLSDRVVVLSSRPARVREVVPVEIPRPRALAVKRSRALGEKVEHIWALIADEARRAARGSA
jgi:NitT/TauT family transport system ATP-binding protein